MSDKLMINGKKYVSASVAANMTKYTQDYVGQLCRGDKVNATRIGRNWYVDIDSLLSYKEQSESSIVEINISAPQNIHGQKESIEESVENGEPKSEESFVIPITNLERTPVKPEIDYKPVSAPTQRIVGEHVANYSYDKSPLLPPLKKLSVEPEIENIPLVPKKAEIQPESEINTKIPEESHREPSQSLFNRVMCVLWPLRERIALALALIVMFSTIFALNGTKIQYEAPSIASIGSIIERQTVVDRASGVLDIFEEVAIDINDFVDNTTYNFLYMP